MTTIEIERWLCERIAHSLRIEPNRVDVSTPFPALGLDSLTLFTLTGELAERLQCDMPTSLVWQYPTISQLSAYLPSLSTGQRNLKEEDRTTRPNEFPLSFAQANIWRYARMETVQLHYQTTRNFLVHGELDVSALQQALDEIVRRHEHLRTTFSETDGIPRQRVHSWESRKIVITDLSASMDPDAEAISQVRALNQRPLDLGHGPLFITYLFPLRERETLLVFQLHHILYDVASFAILYSELEKLYDAFLDQRPSPPPDLPLQMGEYAAWENERLNPAGTYFQEEVRWWKEYWQAPLPAPAQFDFQRPTPLTTARPEDAKQLIEIPERLRTRLDAVSRATGATPYTIHFAAFVAALSQYSRAHRQFIVGTYVSTRSARGVDALIGYFINLLGFRLDLTGISHWRSLIDRVRHAVEEVAPHQEIQRHELNDAFLRSESSLPIPQVIFQHVKNPNPLQLKNVKVEPWTKNSKHLAMPHGLLLNVVEFPQNLSVTFTFDATLFDPQLVAAFLESYRNNLQAMAGDLNATVPGKPVTSWRFRIKQLLRRLRARTPN